MLDDEHPTIANTIESIDYVEKSKENAIPSASDLLSKWADASDELDATYSKPSAIICSSAMDPMITNFKSLLTPTTWYRTIADSGCSGGRHIFEHSDESSMTQLASPQHVPAIVEQEGGGRYTI